MNSCLVFISYALRVHLICMWSMCLCIPSECHSWAHVGLYLVFLQCCQWDGCSYIRTFQTKDVVPLLRFWCSLFVLLPTSSHLHHNGMKDMSDDLCYWILVVWCWWVENGTWQQIHLVFPHHPFAIGGFPFAVPSQHDASSLVEDMKTHDASSLVERELVLLCEYLSLLFFATCDAQPFVACVAHCQPFSDLDLLSPFGSPIKVKPLIGSCRTFDWFFHVCVFGCFWSFETGVSRFPILEFDQTHGYPGEGPSTWSICTANIDAIQTHPDCLKWDFDALAFQETRINQQSLKQINFELDNCNRSLIHGGLLIPKKTKANTFVTPHGGVALVANKGFVRKFTESDDLTGLWADLSRSTRVSAAWVQVLPKVRALIFSFYGETSKHDNSHLRVNNFMLDRILAVASQYGDIPIILCGDFQADPDAYEAIVAAKQHGKWSDPLCMCDQHGNPTRPITFSRNAKFSNPTEYFSSIDAILLNQTASLALASIEMDYSRAKQHAPIIARFKWPKLFVEGTVYRPPAPLDLQKIPRNDKGEPDFSEISQNAEVIWNSKFQPLCDTGDDDHDWEQLNLFALESLVASGARFTSGRAERAQKPVFATCKPCPGQSKDGSVLTKKISEIVNFNKQLVELTFRLARHTDNGNDARITRILHLKVIQRATRLHIDIPAFQDLLTIEQAKDLQRQVAFRINQKRNAAKRERIKTWKQKMIFGTKTKNVHSFVYKWIKCKSQVEVPNLIVDASGNVIFNPTEAIEEINQQWDKVFSANVFHQDPIALLKFVWPYIDQVRCEATVPEIDGRMLFGQIRHRKANAASGMDGWRTVETQCLPIFVLDKIAIFFRGVEDGSRRMPKQLATAKQVHLKNAYFAPPDFPTCIYRNKIQATPNLAEQCFSM